MTASTDKFDRKMKKLIKADWAAKEVAAVSHRLNKRPFAAQADCSAKEAVKEECLPEAQVKEQPVRRIRRRRVRNW